MQKFQLHLTYKSFIIVAFASAVCFSQTITISGTVKNSSGAAISGAEVELEKENKSVKTDSEGKFSFAPTGINSKGNPLQTKKLSAHLKDNVLFLSIFKRGPVEITAYALNGQTFFSMQKVMDAGLHDITLPLRGNGVYICRIKSGNGELLLKNIPVGGVSGSSSITLSGIVTTAKKADSHAAFKDILTVTRDGYLDWQIEVWKPDTTLKIDMINCAGTVKDASGNVYQSVKIGNQVWTTDNLKTKKYNDGTDIPQLSDNNKWSNDNSSGWCYNENKEENGKNGLLYNFWAASHPKIAPEGWRVPTYNEQLALRTYMISAGFNYDGKKYDNWNGQDKDKENRIAKAMSARIDWGYMVKDGEGFGKVDVVCIDMHSNNKSGLNLKPNGSRWCDASFHILNEGCYLWSSTKNNSDDKNALYTHMHSYQSYYGTGNNKKASGFAIRLIKD